MLIKVTDNFKSRHVYDNAVFYCKGSYSKNTEVIDFFADRINHSWEERIIRINENKIRLKLYTPHDENMKRKFGAETLDIEFFGDDEAKKSSKRDLEGLTGVKIDD